MTGSRFGKPVARAGIEIESVEFLQILDTPQALRAERAFTIESVEHDALEEISKRHIVILPERFQHFQDSFFHAHAGLHAFHDELLPLCHSELSFWYQCTKIPKVRQGTGPLAGARKPDIYKNKSIRAPIHISVISKERIRW